VNVRIRLAEQRFVAGSTRATFGAGVTVNTTTVESPTSLAANARRVVGCAVCGASVYPTPQTRCARKRSVVAGR
jgi:hypothetical protein